MSDRMYVATRKGLFTFGRTRDAARPWQLLDSAFLGVPVTIVLPDSRDGWIYAAVDHGHFGTKLHRSKDSKSWEECTAPAYPPLPEGVEPDQCPMRGIPIPPVLKLIWSLEAGGADEPGALWCGTVPGGLFRSEDRGTSWKLIDSLWNRPERKNWFGGGMDLPGMHSICVNPRDSRHVTVAVSCGGVWQTKDRGQTWECTGKGMYAVYMPPEKREDPTTQDPHRLVQCAREPKALWVQHHNGIFKSINGGARWTEVPSAGPSTFGFAVAVHPQHPETAWFVPATSDEVRIPVGGKVVVTRTRDGGRSFDVLTEGLPQQHAYDIAFRHCLDVDESGERLAFGSTTGGLWTSDNQGDSWREVTAHLPPVYCVRFG